MTFLIFWSIYLKFILSVAFLISFLATAYTFYVQDSIYFITYFNIKFSKKFYGVQNIKILNRLLLNFFNKFYFINYASIIAFKKMF